jgi:hypothetical protein
MRLRGSNKASRTLDEHSAITTAVEKHDNAGAELAMDNHLDRAKRRPSSTWRPPPATLLRSSVASRRKSSDRDLTAAPQPVVFALALAQLLSRRRHSDPLEQLTDREGKSSGSWPRATPTRPSPVGWDCRRRRSSSRWSPPRMSTCGPCSRSSRLAEKAQPNGNVRSNAANGRRGLAGLLRRHSNGMGLNAP